jgi:hypothetical protein
MQNYEPLPGIERSNAPWCDPENSAKFISLDIGEDITSIGDYAFYGCDFKGTTPFDANLTRIGKYALSRTGIFYTRIPETVIEIEEGTYAHCTKLERFEIRNGLTRIGEKAFYGCTLLSKVEIPRSVVSIGKEAFAFCDNLSEIVIGKRVAKIADNAFAKSENLSAENSALVSVTNLNPVPQNVSTEIFANTDLSQATLFVPSDSIEAYKAADVWKEFGKIQTIKKPVYKKIEYDENEY